MRMLSWTSNERKIGLLPSRNSRCGLRSCVWQPRRHLSELCRFRSEAGCSRQISTLRRWVSRRGRGWCLFTAFAVIRLGTASARTRARVPASLRSRSTSVATARAKVSSSTSRSATILPTSLPCTTRWRATLGLTRRGSACAERVTAHTLRFARYWKATCAGSFYVRRRFTPTATSTFGWMTPQHDERGGRSRHARRVRWLRRCRAAHRVRTG